MGYERKRGKLERVQRAAARRQRRDGVFPRSWATPLDLRVHPLRHHARHRHAAAARCRARSSSGTMAHPLNRPRVRRRARQRRRAATASCSRASASSLPSARRSRFARLFAGDAGIDPYTRAVSDVYQDLFGEGSFIGKGIYDVDAFSAPCTDAFPENRMLSHDLLESVLRPLRAGQRRGAVSRNIPPRYNVDVEPPAPLDTRRLADRALAAAARAGADGRRRAQSAVAAVAVEDLRQPAPQPGAGRAASRCCWAAGLSRRGSAWLWTAVGRCRRAVPRLLAALLELLRKPPSVRWRCTHLRGADRCVRPPLRSAAHLGLPALRRVHQPRRHRAHAVAPAGHPPAAARVADLQRTRSGTLGAALAQLFLRDVGRARRSRWSLAVVLVAHPAPRS